MNAWRRLQGVGGGGQFILEMMFEDEHLNDKNGVTATVLADVSAHHCELQCRRKNMFFAPRIWRRGFGVHRLEWQCTPKLFLRRFLLLAICAPGQAILSMQMQEFKFYRGSTCSGDNN